LFLSGCASYNASPLNNLTVITVQKTPGNTTNSAKDLTVVTKAYTKADCKKYLDRDVIEKGYQPIQLFIKNDTEKNYVFSLNRLSVPCARPEEVAEKVHTSTAGRAAGYGAAALILWPLAIPAVVDGVKSSNANEALDNDFSSKTARDQVIAAHSYFNKIIFVPVNESTSNLTVTLIDQENGQTKEIKVIAQ
jgi:hypothetical protein